jgi:hypothetical protein
MTIYMFALIMAALYLAAGVLGFFPTFLTAVLPGDPPLAVDANYGYLFGVFPVNLLHNLVHLAIGGAALLAWRGVWSAQAVARFIAVFYGTLAIMGLIPGLNTMFGLTPLFSHDVWLHAVSAAAGAYYGWAYPIGRDRMVSRRAAA